jgi:hypothetical protein
MLPVSATDLLLAAGRGANGVRIAGYRFARFARDPGIT